MLVVSVQQEDFDTSALQRQLLAGEQEEGAVATFTGYVRAANTGREVRSMELEHYPGMTESSIQAIVERACKRWPLLAVSVVHRVGRLQPGDRAGTGTLYPYRRYQRNLGDRAGTNRGASR